jgi:hypothetical protein
MPEGVAAESQRGTLSVGRKWNGVQKALTWYSRGMECCPDISDFFGRSLKISTAPSICCVAY